MTEIYKIQSYSYEDRAQDLLNRMTIEEKVGQMCQVDGRKEPELWIKDKNVGSFLHIVGEEAIRLQKISSEETRLGIPLIFGIDAIHGHAFYNDATVFPSQLGLSSSWNTDLLQEVAHITAKEVILTGLHWTFSPVLCLGRDMRWGRVDETFGEDPYLAGVLGAAMVKGYQGEKLSDPYSILSCPKHFAAYGETQGGRDSTESDVSPRKLKTVFLPPFKAAVDAGCATIMAGYNSIDGLPCSANKWLLTDILKNQFNFKGFVVTDWNNTGNLYSLQKIAPSLKKSCEIVINAGNDMIMTTPEFYDNAVELVKKGIISEKLIDQACLRILLMKFKLGLFDEKRYPDCSNSNSIIGCDQHKNASYKSALESIVLLKNEENVLPITNKIKKIAVVGPNADDVVAQLGDWSFGPRDFPERSTLEYNKYDTTSIVTILEGIKKRAGSEFEVVYEKGCDVIDESINNIDAALKISSDCDIIIAVVGDTIVLNGETRDRASLDLLGRQEELLKELKNTGKPLIVVLINGKPLTIPWVKDNAHAIIEAWNPGMEGGNAVASILFGDYNPCGKLSISFPRHVGQQPVYYNQYPGWHGGKYADLTSEPLFHFGYGISYTSYEYSNLKLASYELDTDDELLLTIDVKNTGTVKGTEIVQVYINDIYSCVTTPIKELKGFARVELNGGETKNVQIKIPISSLALIDSNLNSFVEPGEFEVMVGGSSKDEDLIKAVFKVL
ncbi:UNVERIFIED_CONTAM: beta-glucosidase [Acetivibrio alkalicellulosi]